MHDFMFGKGNTDQWFHKIKTSRNPVAHLLMVFVSFFTFSCNSKTEKYNRPNILLCIADDASWEYFQGPRSEWINTPAIDKIASEGLIFQNAYTPNAKCSPSRSCILTGRNSWQLEAACNHAPYFPSGYRTYHEVLDQYGYYVGYTGKGWAPGEAYYADGNPRDLLVKQYNELKTIPPTSEMSDIDYASNFREFIKNKPDGQPFCFWFGAHEPHRRYEFMSGMKKGGKKPDEIDRGSNIFKFCPDVDSIRADLLDYAYEIEYFDAQIKKMMDLLEETGEIKNTLVVITADNGMPFPRIKGQEYEMSNHLPLIIKWEKGIADPGREIKEFVSFIDLAPTFLDIAAIRWQVSGMRPITGHSLTDIMYNKPDKEKIPGRDRVLIGKERHDVGRPNDQGYPIRGIVKGDFLYIMNFQTDRWPAGNPETGYLDCDGSPSKTVILNQHRNPVTSTLPYWGFCFGKRISEELYQLSTDRQCIHNLAGESAYIQIKIELKNQLKKELTEQGDPRFNGHPDIFDNYPYAREERRNYHFRYLRGEVGKVGWVNKTDYEPFNDPESQVLLLNGRSLSD